jgi:2-oxoglutarate ferredoxin oxidoreductase subunit alpha
MGIPEARFPKRSQEAYLSEIQTERMTVMDYNLLIGGAAGQGMETLTNLLERIFKRQGFHVFTTHDYMSRVRGGHNFMQIRFGDRPLHAHRLAVDGIIALNRETAELHLSALNKDGFLICDTTVGCSGGQVIPLPMLDLATEAGNPKAAGTVAIGAVLRLFGLSLDSTADVLALQFPKEETAAVNRLAIEAGHHAVSPRFPAPERIKERTHLLNGNQAIGLGALAAGCRFYSAYPMTPSTSVMNFLAEKMAETGILVEQAEDEIAAINMAIGASFAGVRAMTGTSGGGFCLKSEAIGLAGMTETPLVVLNVMRPGPATGLPTRTEQADLQFVIHAAQGEYPRMVIAVRNPEDAYRQTLRAFSLADRYQMPVILLSDQYLADSRQTVPPIVVEPADGPEGLADAAGLAPFTYKRYLITDSGISPRLIPGRTPNQILCSDSDEHDEWGHITEADDVRKSMVDKRARKMAGVRDELEEPALYGPPDASILLLAWGSMEGPVREALDLLTIRGISAKAIVFGDIWPLPVRELKTHAANSVHIINVEQNSTGQLALLVREATGIAVTGSVLRYDGRQIPPLDIANEIEAAISSVTVADPSFESGKSCLSSEFRKGSPTAATDGTAKEARI